MYEAPKWKDGITWKNIPLEKLIRGIKFFINNPM